MDIEQITEQMTALVSAAEAENRSLTDEEVERYEALEKDLQRAQKTAEIRKRTEAYTTAAAGAPAVITARSKGDEDLERAFESYLRTGQVNADLVELRAQAEGTGSAGGYLVPEGFRNRITSRRASFGGIARVAEVITTETGAPLPWPTNDDTSNTGEIVAENATGAAGADLAFGQKTLGAFKFASFGAGNAPLKVSVEMLQDAAFDVQGFISRKLADRIGRKESLAFAMGLGHLNNEPEGLIAGGAYAVTLNQSATVTYESLLDLVHSVDPAYRDNAKFVMNDTTLKLVRKMTDENGRPLWLPEAQAGMTTLPGGSLLGYEVVVDQGVPSTGAGNKIIAFGDIEQAFVIRRVRDIVLVVNPYSSAAYGQVEFHAWSRADSLIQDENAYAILRDKP